MFSRCSPHHDLCSSTYCAVALFFVSCYPAAVQRGALAQPIQLGLLVAEEKLFRRHTSSFKGDIKDTKDKKNNKDNIFKLFRRHTLALWRISTFYLFSKTFKYCLLANLLGGKCLEIYFNNCLMQNTWKTNSSELSCLRMFLSRKEVITELYRLSHETWSRPWNWEA